MKTPFSLKQRNYYPWLFLALGVTANLVVALVFQSLFSPNVFLTVTGAVAALVHFLYTQHNHNTERFIGLFREFNSRYDQLNDRLNNLLAKNQPLLLSEEEGHLLYDYFNLCAEEYLYFKSGYIDSEVWTAWLRGMRIFANNKEIRRFWQEELNAGSYYGFTLAIVDEML